MTKEVDYHYKKSDVLDDEENALYHQAQNSVRKSINRGQINLLYTDFNKGREKLLHVIEKSSGRPVLFAFVHKISDDPKKTPLDLILNSGTLTPGEIISVLPIFMKAYYPQTSGLPIHLYKSIEDFRKYRPPLASAA